MTESTQHSQGSAPRPTAPQTYPQLRVLGWLLIVTGFAGTIFGLVYLFALLAAAGRTTISLLAVAAVTPIASLAAIGVGVALPVLADVATMNFANNRMLARLTAHIQQTESPDE